MYFRYLQPSAVFYIIIVVKVDLLYLILNYTYYDLLCDIG